MMRALAACLVAVLSIDVHPVQAGQLIVKIQAGNPARVPRTVKIRSNLPAGVGTNDVVELAGLRLGYDVKQDLYYVYGELALGPKEIVVKEVRIDDIWLLDVDEVKRYAMRAETLAAALQGTPFSAEAGEEAVKVRSGVAEILDKQDANLIGQVTPVLHIRAYDENRHTLERVRKRVGTLENLAMAAGINPGADLMGDDSMAGAARRDASVPIEYGAARVRITVQNRSATLPKTVQVKRDMPPEITVEDIIDPGGLQVRTDGGLICVYLNDLQLQPAETRTFDVVIRDKWNINVPRIEHLRRKVARLEVEAKGPKSLAAVENTIAKAAADLETLAAEDVPTTLNAAYVAYFRRQAERLDTIEESLNRVEAALRRIEGKRGFEIPAPDKRTTWLVIYAILGFLAVLSLLFFLRWFGRNE
jgi:hypothetical protein